MIILCGVSQGDTAKDENGSLLIVMLQPNHGHLENGPLSSGRSKTAPSAQKANKRSSNRGTPSVRKKRGMNFFAPINRAPSTTSTTTIPPPPIPQKA